MAKEFVANVMVRLTEEDFGVLQAILLPGEPRPHAYLRVAKAAAMPPTVMLMYRKAPLFPEWMGFRKLSPIDADWHAQRLLKNGFEVKVAPTEPDAPRPLHPDDLEEEEEEVGPARPAVGFDEADDEDDQGGEE